MKSRIRRVSLAQGSLCLAVLLGWSTTAGATDSTAENSHKTSSAKSAKAPPEVASSGSAKAEIVEPAKRMAEAKQRFNRGLSLYNDGDPSLALIEFNRAYQLVPNYRVLYNIGQVGIQLGQYANARRALERYLSEAGNTLAVERRAEVTTDLQMLAGRTALLVVSSTVRGADVLVDDIVVGTTPLSEPLLIDAGVHRVVLRRVGYDAHVQRITLAGGDRREIVPSWRERITAGPVIVMQEAPNDGWSQESLRNVAWVATGALTTGALITGLLGWSENTEYNELSASRPEDIEDLRARLTETESNVNTLLLATDVLTASALIAGGLSLWLTMDSDEPATTEDTVTFERFDLQVGNRTGQLRVRGSF